MRMLDALDFAARSPGAATAKEFPRSTSVTGSAADRPIERDRASRKNDDDADFEESLNGLVAAGAASSPAAASANAQGSQQRPAEDASQSAKKCPKLPGASSAIGVYASASPNVAESLSFPPIGASAQPFGAVEAETGAAAATLFQGEMKSAAQVPTSDGTPWAGRASVDISLNETSQPSLLPTGFPGIPVGSTAAETGTVGAPLGDDQSTSVVPLQMPDDATAAIEASPDEPGNIPLPLLGSDMKPAEPAPAPAEAIAATNNPPSIDRGATTTSDRSGRTALVEALAETLRETVPVAGQTSDSDPNVIDQPTVSLGPPGTSSTAEETTDPFGSTDFGPDSSASTSTVNHVAPALVVTGTSKFDPTIDANEGQLWRIELASTAQNGLSNQPEVANGDLGSEPRESDHDSHTAGVDSLFANGPMIDKATHVVNGNPTRSDGASGATVADQIFGEIAGKVELSRRDGKIDFRMRLDPPGLGTVQVHLVATGNSVSAQLVVNDETARQAIESQLNTLRESLADLGVTLDRSFVARDGGGGAGGAWQWQQPERPSTTSGVSIQRFGKRPIVLSSRPATGVIDVVV